MILKRQALCQRCQIQTQVRWYPKLAKEPGENPPHLEKFPSLCHTCMHLTVVSLSLSRRLWIGFLLKGQLSLHRTHIWIMGHTFVVPKMWFWGIILFRITVTNGRKYYGQISVFIPHLAGSYSAFFYQLVASSLPSLRKISQCLLPMYLYRLCFLFICKMEQTLLQKSS